MAHCIALRNYASFNSYSKKNRTAKGLDLRSIRRCLCCSKRLCSTRMAADSNPRVFHARAPRSGGRRVLCQSYEAARTPVANAYPFRNGLSRSDHGLVHSHGNSHGSSKMNQHHRNRATHLFRQRPKLHQPGMILVATVRREATELPYLGSRVRGIAGRMKDAQLP